VKENLSNKQNSLAVDGTNTKYPTVAVAVLQTLICFLHLQEQ
jgi:hypothetical protein